MLYETAYQAMEAPLMLLAGMMMAAAALVFRMIRQALCAKLWLSLICDMVLGAVWGAAFIAAVTIANYGSLRLYHILLCAAGALLFHWAIGIPLTAICRRTYGCALSKCRGLSQKQFMRFLLK